MALKDNWVDLEDAVEGVPDSGSDITVEPINKIARAVIALEAALKELSDAGITVDLSNYYTKDETDNSLKLKENVSNKITFEEWNSSDNKGELLFNDDKYISSFLALALHEEINLRLNNEVEQFENKKCAEGEIIANAPYYSVIATQEYVENAIGNKQDCVTIPPTTAITDILYEFDNSYNTEKRFLELNVINFFFGDDEYEVDYISSLSFYSGSKPTGIAYPDSGILNWVGTDCSADSYVDDNGIMRPISKFQPSANTHYDIVFYFNGTQIIGLVNGFVPAAGNAQGNVVSE